MARPPPPGLPRPLREVPAARPLLAIREGRPTGARRHPTVETAEIEYLLTRAARDGSVPPVGAPHPLPSLAVPLPDTIIPAVVTVAADEECATAVPTLTEVAAHGLVTSPAPAAAAVGVGLGLVGVPERRQAAHVPLVAPPRVQARGERAPPLRPLDVPREALGRVRPRRDGAIRPIPQMAGPPIRDQGGLGIAIRMASPLPVLAVPGRGTAVLAAPPTVARVARIIRPARRGGPEAVLLPLLTM